MINKFMNEEIEIMQSKIELFNEIANVINKKNKTINELEEELCEMKLKYLNVLAIQKELEVVKNNDFYNILDKDKNIMNYSEDAEFIDDWMFSFEEVEEFIKAY